MIQRLLGSFSLFFVLVTYPLWIAAPALNNPHIPWLKILISVPFGFDLCLIVCLITACLGLLLTPPASRIRQVALWSYFISLGCLILLDQHRLQPWALQFLMISFVLAVARQSTAIKCCRWIVLTIYFYSALSKFDVSFYSSHGQLLLDGLLKALRIDGAFWTDEFRSWLTMLFPIGELAVVLLLLFKITRRYGVLVSVVMHFMIILAVGPLGLNHEYGVLLWNLFFIIQNYFLFWSVVDEESDKAKDQQEKTAFGSLLAVGLTMLFGLLPLLENWGWYDHWPAWAVYSSRPEKVTILVDQAAADNFPDYLKTLSGTPQLFEEKVPVSLDRWSFSTRYCPIYPQLRYRLALAKALLEESTEEDEIEIIIQMTPDRMTGKKITLFFEGWNEINKFMAESFDLNTQSRRIEEQR